MKQAETTLADNRDIPLEYDHYTFNLPSVSIFHIMQDKWDHSTSKHLVKFGICCDSNMKQHNYLIKTIASAHGANTHGHNSVILMLDHYFRTHNLHETRCHLHCDNCVGQSKNNSLLPEEAGRKYREE